MAGSPNIVDPLVSGDASPESDDASEAEDVVPAGYRVASAEDVPTVPTALPVAKPTSSPVGSGHSEVAPLGEADDTSTDFAPSDYSDNRDRLEWERKYPKRAYGQIYLETGYVIALVVVSALVLWDQIPEGAYDFSNQDSQPIATLKTLLLVAFTSGVLGGTCFDIKWLYHSVAKQIWNADRLLWRLLTPVISGVLATAIVLLVVSGLLGLFDPAIVKNYTATISISFLVGYFSDTALAKLAEVAETIFGATKDSSKSKRHPHNKE